MVTVLLASRTVPPLVISAYDLTLMLGNLTACRTTIAAVKVDLPWSMWPIVPTLTWGLVRVKTSLAIVPPQKQNPASPEAGPWEKRSCYRVQTNRRKLLLGFEPRTSSLPRTRSTG